MSFDARIIQAPAQLHKVLTIVGKEQEGRDDLLAVESPMEIRLGYGKQTERRQKSLTITMRTPGQDLELSMGFLFAEGIIRNTDDVLSVKHCIDQGKEESKGNVVRVELAPHCKPEWKKLERQFYASSSCGICGKSSIEAIQNLHCKSLAIIPQLLPAATIHGLGEKLRQGQQVFGHTGGLHAAAFFSPKGEILNIKEDVGRHNAVDKLIGASFFAEKLPAEDQILFLSGRISFELVQKALAARVPVIVAVGAPSSLAVDFAETCGISLIGFARNQRFNIYTHPQRIQL